VKAPFGPGDIVERWQGNVVHVPLGTVAVCLEMSVWNDDDYVPRSDIGKLCFRATVSPVDPTKWFDVCDWRLHIPKQLETVRADTKVKAKA